MNKAIQAVHLATRLRIISTMKNKFLIVGAGGREAAFAMKLADDAIVCAVIDHANPTIIAYVEQSGGQFCIGSSKDCKTVVNFAKEQAIDFAFISSDEPLANGVVDALLAAGFATVGATKQAAKIEWDKIYSIEYVKQVAPQATPFYMIIDDANAVDDAVNHFQKTQSMIVVKPQGLTGGKGVKVMPIHLTNYKECKDYILQLLAEKPSEKILLCEKLEGEEFTIMGLTDGKNLILAPTTYDYPFRYDGDTGPGTGGMGCYTQANGKLPFLTDDDIESCRCIMQSLINKMQADGIPFNGVLNGGFFKTANGIRFMEFNSRFGDPESLNVLMLLRSSFSQLLISQWEQTLSEKSVQFYQQASVIKYIVASHYPFASPTAITFNVNKAAIGKSNLSLFMGACVSHNNDQYQTLKKSRVLAIGCMSNSVQSAAEAVNNAIDSYVQADGLEFRRDIGLN